MTNQATRIIVRAVGELGQGSSSTLSASTEDNILEDTEDVDVPEAEPILHSPTPVEFIDYLTYTPKIDGNMWELSETDLCTSSPLIVLREIY